VTGTSEVWGILQERGKCIRDGEIAGLLPPGEKRDTHTLSPVEHGEVNSGEDSL